MPLVNGVKYNMMAANALDAFFLYFFSSLLLFITVFQTSMEQYGKWILFYENWSAVSHIIAFLLKIHFKKMLKNSIWKKKRSLPSPLLFSFEV